MKGNLAPVPTSRMSDSSRSAEEGRPGLSLAPEASAVIRTFAAFLLALEEDESVELDDGLTRHLDAVGEAIGFL